jgi:FkbM family methyltransferase
MSIELLEKSKRRINIVRKYPSEAIMKYIMKYIHRAQNRLVGYEIPRLNQNYEKFFRVKKGDVVVDVGAHIGLFTRSVAKRANMVVAIECEPNNLKQLRRNLRNFSNVLVVGKALWNDKGRLPLYLSYSSEGHSLIRDVRVCGVEYATDRGIMVDADTLDNVLSGLGISKVDFVKMDIEGAEIEALEGASEALKKTSKIVVASYHERGGVKTTHEVVRKLTDNGFKVYTTLYDYDLVCGLKKQE